MIHLSFRAGFRAGFLLALVIGIYLFWLWRPERQVRLHNHHLLSALEAKDWSRFAGFIDESYRDQWRDDRPLLLARIREVLRYARNLRIDQLAVDVSLGDDEAQCRARIRLDADDSEIATLIKQRVNALETPFVFQWRHASAKPWDWKLVRASNDQLEVPESAYDSIGYLPSAVRSSVFADSTSLSFAPQSSSPRKRSP